MAIADFETGKFMRLAVAVTCTLFVSPVLADKMRDMGGMSMPGMEAMPEMASTGVFGPYPMTREASGTRWQPDAAAHHGIHLMSDDWMFMLHGRLLGIYDTQSGPRGDDQTLVSGMVMASARRDFTSGDTL